MKHSRIYPSPSLKKYIYTERYLNTQPAAVAFIARGRIFGAGGISISRFPLSRASLSFARASRVSAAELSLAGSSSLAVSRRARQPDRAIWENPDYAHWTGAREEKKGSFIREGEKKRGGDCIFSADNTEESANYPFRSLLIAWRDLNYPRRFCV